MHLVLSLRALRSATACGSAVGFVFLLTPGSPARGYPLPRLAALTKLPALALSIQRRPTAAFGSRLSTGGQDIERTAKLVSSTSSLSSRVPATGTQLDLYLADMPQPKLTILGVYRPVISPETWKEQWEVTADDEITREHFDKLVLIEAFVEGLTEPFDMSEFGQMRIDRPDDPSNMMVGYDEGLLSHDGEFLILREMDCVQGTGPLRFAVYLHEYDPQRPLRWQCGEVSCPAVSEVPPRLMTLMPYTASD